VLSSPGYHQGIICGVTFDRSTLRRIPNTPQSSLLGALHLTPRWCPGLNQNQTFSLMLWKLEGGFLFVILYRYGIRWII
jgi:hypothetical protein